jgi:hypothetical protein
MTMEGLGRVFNSLQVASGVYVSMKDCGAISFLCTNAAGDTWTLTEAKDAAGTSAAVLATITRYHTQVTVGAVWALQTQAAASTIVTTASQDACVVTISEAELSDTFDWIKVTATGAGTVVALQHDLQVQRDPTKLAALV